MKTVLINLFAGPGAGKSTLAAGLFHLLKKQGESVELVTEFVKDWAWEGRAIGRNDQLRIFTEQWMREVRLYGKVQYIITDSPTQLSKVYTEQTFILPLVSAVEAEKVELGVQSVNVYVPRLKPYVEAGRYQTEEQARELDRRIYEAVRSDVVAASLEPERVWGQIVQRLEAREVA